MYDMVDLEELTSCTQNLDGPLMPPRPRGRLPRWAVLALLPALFLASLSLVVGLCAQLLPALADGAGQLPLPLSLAAIHESTHTILQAAERHPLLVASTYASIYIFVQSWGVPGAFLLNALGGALFGTIWGTLFNDILCVTGASFKYLMSREFGSRLFASAACSCLRFEERIRVGQLWECRATYLEPHAFPCVDSQPLRLKVDAARKQHTLFFFLISLRVFPGMPREPRSFDDTPCSPSRPPSSRPNDRRLGVEPGRAPRRRPAAPLCRLDTCRHAAVHCSDRSCGRDALRIAGERW